MRRTLLAVGVAVLVSMLLAPHGDKRSIEGFGPFFTDYCFSLEKHEFIDPLPAQLDASRPGFTWADGRKIPEWAKAPLAQPVPDRARTRHFKTIVVMRYYRVMIDILVLEIVFLATLFAVLVNLRKSWRRSSKLPHRNVGA